MFEKAVCLDVESIDTGDIDWGPLRALARDWGWYDVTQPGETAERIAGAELVISNKVRLDRELLAANPQLRLICISATGTNNVDLEAAASLGIAVCNVTAYATPSVVQHVFGLILALVTRQADYQRAVARGDWSASSQFCLLDYPIWEIAGKTLGIVGFGELGRGVASVAESFGMQVLVAERPGGGPQPGRLPLAELLPQVDVLSLHVPLADNTRNLIGREQLALMQPHALLINTARGGIVDEQALANALLCGDIGGAGIDVLAEEPPARDNPLLAPDIPNLIITPHTAWASREARQRLVDGMVANIEAFLRGERRNRVC